MTNRVAQYWASVDAVLKATSADAMQEATKLAAVPVTTTQPIELFLERKYVRAVVEISVRQLKRHAVAQAHNPVVQAELEAEIARRLQFIEWLKADRDTPQVYCNLSPAAQFPSVPSEEPDDRSW
jgi:hypothetical protein